MPDFKIIAHRGASAYRPDNTAQAFQLALDQQADMIETDVRLTRDGVLILEHDEDFGGLLVADSTLAELRAEKPALLTVGAGLAQFGNRVPFCWELKATGIETALVNLIRDLVPAGIWQQTQFTSFIFKTAAIVQQLVPDVQVGWLTGDWDERTITRTQAAGLKQICPPALAILAAPSLMQIASQAGLTVRAWLVRDPQMVPQLADLGVFGGTVNFPDEARKALTQR